MDYTTRLNIVFLALAGLLVWRFLKTGGRAMFDEWACCNGALSLGRVVNYCNGTLTRIQAHRRFSRWAKARVWERVL
jgi:hypothetical protein